MTPRPPAATPVAGLLTVHDYLDLPADGAPTELVRGRVVPMPPAGARHCYVCGQIYFAIASFVRAADLGRVLSNDAPVLTGRDPDTLRGADVAFYSYERAPRGPLPEKGPIPAPPDLTFEVLSPSDRWKQVLTKMGEYLDAGVTVVCVADPDTRTVQVYRDALPQTLHGDDELTLPDVLPGFCVPVRQLFE